MDPEVRSCCIGNMLIPLVLACAMAPSVEVDRR